MGAILTELRNVVDDMNQLAVPYALVGGLAVSAHGEPRSTRDIDFAVAIASKNDQRDLVERLRGKGYGGEQVLMHVEPTHVLGTRVQSRGSAANRVAIDLLFSSSGIEAEIVKEAVSIEILPRIHVPIACRGHLIAMKILAQNDTDRIRDKSDLRDLLTRAGEADVSLARESVRLMMTRGFARGKDLVADLEAALVVFPALRP